MAGVPLRVENLLPVQLLLLASLGLQVTLFLCAGVRRIDTSGGGLRWPLLWLAYNSADAISTATMSRLWFTKSNHPLVALWAPFPLLHLAGPDNIAAYALQDNQLWLRNLQSFFSRVIPGAYLLYANRDGSGNFVLLASRLMFVVGAVKYGERCLALQRGNLSSIRDSVNKYRSTMHSHHFHPQDIVLEDVQGADLLDEESHLRRAHLLIDICKRAIVGSSEKDQHMEKMMCYVEYWTLVEMELSIMYEILYTKAAVIHTWHGYSVRVLSPLTILTSLLLYQFSGEVDWQRGLVDTAVTYVLFGAALSMESISLLNTLGSSWMLAYLTSTRFSWLRYKVLCSRKWHLLRNKVVSLGRLVTCGRCRYKARRWSGKMGQYNMLHFCTRPNTPLTRPVLGTLAMLVGLGELWNRKHFSGTISFLDHVLIKVFIAEHAERLYMKAGGLNTLGMVKRPWAMTALRHHGLQEKFEEEKILGDEFQEAIIIWHIATDFFLAECKSANPNDVDLVKAIKGLSNYMMFLLVERPYMLPGIAQSKLYERICAALTKVVSHRPTSICSLLRSLFRCHDDPAASNSRATDSKILAEKLYHMHKGQKFSYETVRLTYSAKVAEILLAYQEDRGHSRKSLDLLLEVWADMLVYAGNKCSRESHAKKLSSGCELTTIAWLFLEHCHQGGLEQDGHI